MDGTKFVMTDTQFAELMCILGEIKQALSPGDLASDECPHPEEQRVSFRSAGDPDHWYCRACKEHFGMRVTMP